MDTSSASHASHPHGAASRRSPAVGRRWAVQALSGVPLLLALVLYGQAAVERELERVEVDEALEVGLGAGAVERHTVDLARDLAHVVGQASLRRVLEDPSPENLARLNEDFSTFSASRLVYDQVRWIDETGRERARVDLRDGRPHVVPPEELLDKGARYTFREAMKLAPGELYLSPLDLKVDGEVVAVPRTPILRVGTPVADPAGRRRGIVILNYLARDMLESVEGSTQRHDLVVDRAGYWLRGPTPADEWGFMFERPDLTLGARSPAAWARVSAEPHGQVRLDDGLWTWRTARALVGGPGVGAAPGGRELGWRVVSHMPQAELVALERGVWRGLAVVGGLLAAALGVGSWRLAQASTARAEAEADLRRVNAGLEHLVAERTRVLDEKLAELDAANARLGASAEKLQVILASSLDGYWLLDRSGCLLDANDTYCRLSGYPREELVGRPAWVLEVPHDAAAASARLAQVARDGHGQFEGLHRRKDGSTWNVEASLVYHDVGGGEFVVFLRDITAQKEAEASLRRSEARFRDVALVSANWIWEVDHEARYTYVSESVRAMLGYGPDEMVGRTVWEFMPPEEAARVAAAFGEIAAARVPFYDLENIMLAKDGRPHVTLTNGTPILGPGGEYLGHRGVDRDVTTQRRMEEQVRQLAFVDSLTNLPNRRLLADRLDQALASSDRAGNHGAVLFLDLDDFKPLNDEYGHDAGDALLVQASERLRGCVRALDTVARLGGDEFVVVLKALAAGRDEAAEQAARVAVKIGEALAEPYRIPLPHGGEVEHTCTASVGVVLFRGHELGRDELLRLADEAMYTAKTAGGNTIRFHAA